MRTSLGGELKAIITAPHIALGLADSQAAARRLIRRVDGIKRVESVVEAAVDATSESAIEVIVASLAGPRLYRCREGVVEVFDAGQTFIGDQGAFGVYQEMVSQLSEECEFDVSSLAMRSVISDERFPNVGGLTVSVITTESGLAYSSGIEAHAGSLAPQSIPSGVWTPIQFGQGAGMGAFTCAVCAPVDPGIGAVGVYVYEARAGAVYQPSVRDSAVVIRARTQQEFEAAAAELVGCALSAPFLS